MTWINGKTFIPLVMAPFHENDLISPGLEFAELFISVSFHNTACFNSMDEVQIYGNQYFLDTPARKSDLVKSYGFITVQNQFTGSTPFVNGKNTIPLNFTNILYLIYFWGFDKTKVTNVHLTFDGSTFYDGPLEPLEHKKLSRGYDVEPAMIFFSPDQVHAPSKSSTNFSRIDNPISTITSDEVDASMIHIVGLSIEPICVRNGRVGFLFPVSCFRRIK